MRGPRRELVGPRFDGARELDRLLREAGTSVPEFCATHNLERWTVERLLAGRAKRAPSIDLVCRIETATSGRVGVAMWSRGSLRLDHPAEVVPQTTVQVA